MSRRDVGLLSDIMELDGPQIVTASLYRYYDPACWDRADVGTVFFLRHHTYGKT